MSFILSLIRIKGTTAIMLWRACRLILGSLSQVRRIFPISKEYLKWLIEWREDLFLRSLRKRSSGGISTEHWLLQIQLISFAKGYTFSTKFSIHRLSVITLLMIAIKCLSLKRGNSSLLWQKVSILDFRDLIKYAIIVVIQLFSLFDTVILPSLIHLLLL